MSNIENGSGSTSSLNHNPAVMNSIGAECNTLKHSYDSCFNAWFTDKFLKGDRDLSSCDPLLKMYTECVKKAMERKNIDLREVDQEFLGTANENTKPK